jgi:hypothetical protein
MPAERHSPDGISVGHIGAGAAVIGVAVAVAVLGAWGLIASFGGALHGPSVHPAPLPAPELEKNPLTDRGAYDYKQRQKLSRYGWIDRDKGIVQIPIDAAMTLISRRASRPAAPPAKAATP